MKENYAAASVPLTSKLSLELQGSEIIKLGNEINDRVKAGEHIYNFTIGDFDPAIFPIPDTLKREVVNAYASGETNYPPANGLAELRDALSNFTLEMQGLRYPATDFLVAGGARPLIYAAYQALLDPEELALFSVPSWNNNHYATLCRSRQLGIPTRPENGFMPRAAELEPHLAEAGILALCSPLNPTGTAFSREDLHDICELVRDENVRRMGKRKPLYMVYDQIYWQLSYSRTHVDPVSLMPELRPYTLYIDGISKAFAATGVRVGWSFGPPAVIGRMKAILGHIGAWAPRPEQKATAQFLMQPLAVKQYLGNLKMLLEERLQAFYQVMCDLGREGWPISAVAPEAAIYLAVKIDLTGWSYSDEATGLKTIQCPADTTRFLLAKAKLALVPFSAFGASADWPWYRLSVGTSKASDAPAVYSNLKRALHLLQAPHEKK